MPELDTTDLAREQIASAEEFILEQSAAEGSGSKAPRFFLSAALPLLLALTAALFFALALVRYPVAAAAFAKDPPLHQGGYAADAETDQCVANLWLISRLLQERKPLPANLVCPAGKKPYCVGKDTASCPTPQAHKLHSLRVTRGNPIPEVN